MTNISQGYFFDFAKFQLEILFYMHMSSQAKNAERFRKRAVSYYLEGFFSVRSQVVKTDKILHKLQNLKAMDKSDNPCPTDSKGCFPRMIFRHKVSG